MCTDGQSVSWCLMLIFLEPCWYYLSIYCFIVFFLSSLFIVVFLIDDGCLCISGLIAVLSYIWRDTGSPNVLVQANIWRSVVIERNSRCSHKGANGSRAPCGNFEFISLRSIRILVINLGECEILNVLVACTLPRPPCMRLWVTQVVRRCIGISIKPWSSRRSCKLWNTVSRN